MKLKVTRQAGIAVIALEGNLMGGPDASLVNAKLHELVEGGTHHVVIDLQGVEFMNSSGLGLLIGGISTMKNAGGSLRFANASPKITSLISITKLGSLFTMYESVDEAVASVRPS